MPFRAGGGDVWWWVWPWLGRLLGSREILPRQGHRQLGVLLHLATRGHQRPGFAASQGPPPALPVCTASLRRTPSVAALRPLAIWGRACSSVSTRGTVRPETPSGASISGKATGDGVSRGSQVFPSLPGVDGRDLLLCLFPLCTEPGEPPTVHEDSFLGEGGVSGWDQGGLERDPERCQG